MRVAPPELRANWTLAEGLCHFDISAECVCKLNLTGRFAFGFENQRRTHKYGNAFRTRSRDIEPVQAVQELHTARRIGVTARWLRTEADAGRIPCLRAGSRLLFAPDAVERELAKRAQECDGGRHG